MTSTKNYRVDSFVAGLGIKAPCVVATTANITLSATQTVNSVAVVVGDRVLVKDQTDTTENGIYNVESSAWTRAGDWDGDRDVVPGTTVPAYDDTTGGYFWWTVTSAADNPVEVGTDAVVFERSVGAITKIGTPADNEVAVWTADGSLEGDSTITASGGTLSAQGFNLNDTQNIAFGSGNDTTILHDNGADETQISTSNATDLVFSMGTGYIVLDTGFKSASAYLNEQAAAKADIAAYGQIWVKNDTPNTLWFTDDAGTDMQISSEVNDLSAAVTWANVPDANVTESSVTQHTAAVVTTSAVTTAGALMDSEVDADVKTLSLPASTTISAFGATLVDDADAAAALATLGLFAPAYAEINAADNATETTISEAGTAVQVTIFDTNGQNSGATPDHTNDHITIDTTGIYKIDVSATLESGAGAGSRAEMSVAKNNGGTTKIIPHVDRNLAGGGGVSGSVSMHGLASLTAADTIEVWVENETNTTNYVIENICLSVVRVG